MLNLFEATLDNIGVLVAVIIMVLLALVIVSFKVSDFGRMILKTLQNADSDIWPRTWETFWTTASKGKKVPGSTFCEIRIFSGGQHNYVHRTWLHTLWRVSFPKCQISCILDMFSLWNSRFVPTPAWCKFPPYQARLQRPYNPMWGSFCVKKWLTDFFLPIFTHMFRKNQNSMESVGEDERVWFPDPEW